MAYTKWKIHKLRQRDAFFLPNIPIQLMVAAGRIYSIKTIDG